MAVGRRPLLVVLRALGLGDLLAGVPALRALARAFPQHRRVLAAPSALAPLVPLVDPELELADVGELRPLPPWLHGAEVAANLHGRGPWSHRILLDAGAGCQRRLWFAHRAVAQSAGAPRWLPAEHERERWCRLLREHGIAADPDDLALSPPAAAGDPRTGHAPAGEAPRWLPATEGQTGHAPADIRCDMAERRPLTVVHPGAASGARRWPAARFAAVARAERERDHGVAVTGSAAEVALAHEVAARANLPTSAVLAGRTDLAALARVVSRADRLVCGDTGVAHLATAFGTPSVVLFGPTSPAEWGPPERGGLHRALWKGPASGGGDPHAERPDPSLLAIEAGEAIDALAALPAPARRTRPRAAA